MKKLRMTISMETKNCEGQSKTMNNTQLIKLTLNQKNQN